MLTRGQRARINQRLPSFDLDPFLSNTDRLPPPISVVPLEPPTQQPEITRSPDVDSLSSLTPLPSTPSTMSSHDRRINPSPNASRPTSPQRTETEIDHQTLPLLTRRKGPEDYKVKEFSSENHLKANGSNFTAWKRLTRLLLRNNKWESFALGTAPCPNKEDYPSEYATWQQIDSLVLSQLAMNMELTLYGEISSDEMSSAELWKAIIDRFEEHSELAQTTVHAKLCGKRV